MIIIIIIILAQCEGEEGMAGYRHTNDDNDDGVVLFVELMWSAFTLPGIKQQNLSAEHG